MTYDEMDRDQLRAELAALTGEKAPPGWVRVDEADLDEDTWDDIVCSFDVSWAWVHDDGAAVYIDGDAIWARSQYGASSIEFPLTSPGGGFDRALRIWAGLKD